MKRRRLLKLTGGTLAVGGIGSLAGCSSSCPDSERPTPDETIAIQDAPTRPFDNPPPGTWPTSHGTAARTGFAPGSLPVENLDVRWRIPLELPPTDKGSLSASAPTVGKGMVLVADRQRVHALSLRDGGRQWRSDPLSVTAKDTRSEYVGDTVPPAVGPDGAVYVATTTGLTSLDGTDGSVRWEADVLTDVAAPAVVDDRVVALGTDSIAAFSPAGDELWQRSVPRGETPIPPAVTESAIFVVTEDGLRSLDPATGDELWTSDLRAETYPVIDNRTCFVGNTEGLHAVDSTSGADIWTFSRGEARAFLSPVVTTDTIYAVEQPGEAGAASFALDRTNGTPDPRWCSYIGSGAVTAATDDHVLAIISLGEGPDAVQGIVSFSKSLGQARWAIEGGDRPQDWVTPPAVVDGTIVVTTRGGTAVAISEVSTDA